MTRSTNYIRFFQCPSFSELLQVKLVKKVKASERLLTATGNHVHCRPKKVKGKGFPYSLPSVGPGADLGVQVVSPLVSVSHPSGGRLPLLSACG